MYILEQACHNLRLQNETTPMKTSTKKNNIHEISSTIVYHLLKENNGNSLFDQNLFTPKNNLCETNKIFPIFWVPCVSARDVTTIPGSTAFILQVNRLRGVPVVGVSERFPQ